MGDKDIISKEILKNIARDIARHILHIEVKKDMELIDKEFTRIEKRDADLIFKNGNEIIHIEIQNNNHPQMHLRMLRYLSDILFSYGALEVKQYLLYMGSTKCRMKNKIKKHQLDYSYDIIDIREIPCKELLYSDDPSAIVLSILCDFGDEEKQEIVNTLLRRLKSLSNDREFKNYFKMVSILSTNRNLQDEVKKGARMLTIDIKKTPIYELGMEDGIQEGIQKGIQKGIKNGVNSVAMKLLKLNIDTEIIHKTTGLNFDEIEKLKESLND